MSRAAFTIRAFGIYLLALGLALVVAPSLLLSLFGVPQTTEVWIRVLGVVVFNTGICYWAAALGEARLFFGASVWSRAFVLACFGGFVLLGMASPALILFGLADAGGALWTWFALRAQERTGERVYPATRIDPVVDSSM